MIKSEVVSMSINTSDIGFPTFSAVDILNLPHRVLCEQYFTHPTYLFLTKETKNKVVSLHCGLNAMNASL